MHNKFFEKVSLWLPIAFSEEDWLVVWKHLGLIRCWTYVKGIYRYKKMCAKSIKKIRVAA